MLHACVQRFDVTGNLEKFCKILGTKQSPRRAEICWPASEFGLLRNWCQNVPGKFIKIPTYRLTFNVTVVCKVHHYIIRAREAASGSLPASCGDSAP